MHKQKGMTFIGLLSVVVLVIMAAIVTMRMVPVYIQHYSIMESVRALHTIPLSSFTGDQQADSEALRRSLTKRLDINGIEDLKEDQVIIESLGENTYSIKIKYQVIRPLAYNVSLLFNFDNTIKVTISSEN